MYNGDRERSWFFGDVREMGDITIYRVMRNLFHTTFWPTKKQKMQ